MHDALPGIVQSEQLDAVLCRIFFDLAHHPGEFRIGDIPPRPACRHIMVRNAEGQAWLRDLNASLGQLAKCVEGTLMNIVTVNPEQRLAVLAADDLMGGPELVDDGLGLVHAWK